jgi:hypothetical protein
MLNICTDNVKFSHASVFEFIPSNITVAIPIKESKGKLCRLRVWEIHRNVLRNKVWASFRRKRVEQPPSQLSCISNLATRISCSYLGSTYQSGFIQRMNRRHHHCLRRVWLQDRRPCHLRRHIPQRRRRRCRSEPHMSQRLLEELLWVQTLFLLVSVPGGGAHSVGPSGDVA